INLYNSINNISCLLKLKTHEANSLIFLEVIHLRALNFISLISSD
ncbi:unnamed protein product, partial [marine sediment metagenome]